MACRVNDRWTVYRLIRIPSWGRFQEPWMAVAPGKAYGQRFATHTEAFAFAQGRAVRDFDEHVERALLEVCS
jgi:hypothetical protein